MGKDTRDTRGTMQIERVLAEQSAVGRRTFFDTLPTDLIDDLVVIRGRWCEGRYKASKSAVARTVRITCTERFGKSPSLDTIKRWLDRGAHEIAQQSQHSETPRA